MTSSQTPTSARRQTDRFPPHYGERMTTFWLDLVRFADTTGYHGDNHVDLYLFRDYVIAATLNADKPFDRFIRSNSLPATWWIARRTRPASLPATTDCCKRPRRGRTAPRYMAKYSADRVRNVSTVWLAATVRCAECHDHKFDPYKAREFYSLSAFFADVKAAVGVQEPTRFPSPAQAEVLEPIDCELACLKAIKVQPMPSAPAGRTGETPESAARADSQLARHDIGRPAAHPRLAARQLAGRIRARGAADRARVLTSVGGKRTPGDPT